MTTTLAQAFEIDCLPGVEPNTDKTNFATEHWTFSDKIRFVDGRPEKIGGWTSASLGDSTALSGAARTVYSAQIGSAVYTVIGTHSKLYSLRGSTLTNITPLQTLSVAAANSLATLYGTLANNPITTVSGSNTLTIADTSASRFRVGDNIVLSGSSDVGGILAAAINTTHKIRSIGVNSYTVRAGSNASSSTSGGGASVVRACGLIQVTSAAHGNLDGDRVKISGAADTGGVLAAQINLEFIIRNVAANTFDVYTAGTSTSSVSAAGGASTVYFEEIPAGRRDASFGQGYGMGRYGVGRYGVSKTSTAGIRFQRTWFCDRYADDIIMTPGNQTGVYTWAGSTSTAPTLLTNAPTAVNYVFVSNNIVVTLGAGGVENKVFTSDQNDITDWTASSTNQVFEDNIEGAGRLLSHVAVAGINLLFTQTQVYTFSYLGFQGSGSPIWDIQLKDQSSGLIAPMARVSVGDIAFWMSDNNFHMYRGGNVEIIPANSQKQSTIRNYVFQNLNFTQKSKNFAWFNEKFNEVWFHYCSAGSNDPDRVARVNLQDFTWTPDTMARLAAEYPDTLLDTPRLAAYSGSDSILYKHESGTDDDGLPLAWTLTTNVKNNGRDTITGVGLIPDSRQIGNISVQVQCFQYPQSQSFTYNNTYTITPTTEIMPITVNGRYRKYTFSGSELGQNWEMGKWQEEIQKGSRN